MTHSLTLTIPRVAFSPKYKVGSHEGNLGGNRIEHMMEPCKRYCMGTRKKPQIGPMVGKRIGLQGIPDGNPDRTKDGTPAGTLDGTLDGTKCHSQIWEERDLFL